MRSSGLLSLFLAGCASGAPPGNVHDCPVWEVSAGPTDGHVNVSPALVSILNAQVPQANLNGLEVCWYQTPDGHLEGYPWNYSGYDTGYEFEYAESGWRYLKRNAYVVLSHRRRR